MERRAMTKMKLCGLRRRADIDYVNAILPEYIGFVFAEKSKRYVKPLIAADLRTRLAKEIIPVGVFVNEMPEIIAEMVKGKIIDMVQLHGEENEEYIRELRALADCKIIKAFQIRSVKDIETANLSSADYVLLDSSGGSGKCFNWTLLKEMKRPYFLAGGLTPENVGKVVEKYHPFAVDASSSLEINGYKDEEKMADFVKAVRERTGIENG